ncbi:MAG: hypothetical protein ABR529_05580 [Actinomycetota bacterium]
MTLETSGGAARSAAAFCPFRVELGRANGAELRDSTNAQKLPRTSARNRPPQSPASSPKFWAQ